jgi:hypothetical protein
VADVHHGRSEHQKVLRHCQAPGNAEIALLQVDRPASMTAFADERLPAVRTELYRLDQAVGVSGAGAPPLRGQRAVDRSISAWLRALPPGIT